MLHEYERLYREAAGLYGDRVVLFLQVGSFFELYWRDGSSGAASAQAARERLNLTIMSRKTPDAPYGTGFPMVKGDEKAGILLDEGWTVCMAEQTESNGSITRSLTRCLSPSMRQDRVDEHFDRGARSGNYAACVYTMKEVVGVAFIDVCTGCSLVTDGDGLNAAAESRNVSEVVFIGDRVTDFYGSPRAKHDRTGEKWTANERAPLAQASVQDVLAQAYGRGPIMTEDLLLLGSRPHCRDALAYLLHFTRRHCLSLGVGLPRPVIFEPSNHVRFSPNALQQLGVLKLDAVLNKAVTPPGRRWFKHRLCTPFSRPADMRDAHQAIADSLSRNCIDAFRDALAKTGDLERLARRVLQGSLQMSSAEQAASQIKAAVSAARLSSDGVVVASCEKILAELAPVLGGSEPFESDPDCRTARTNVQERTVVLDAARAAIHPDARLECSAEGNYRIVLTKTRFKAVPEDVKAKLVATTLSSGMRLWSTELEALADAVKDAEAGLKALLSARWADLLAGLPTDDLLEVATWARDADVTYTGAWNARRFGHCRPVVSDSARASFDAENLGNPVAEHAMEAYSKERYVRNDVRLDDEQQHILLYGLNSCGKSSILRGVGMAIVMTQAGMYAPCTRMALAPFTRIDTRILTPDDIERGLSSFTAEAKEALGAQTMASPTSLLLADEIFCSTEWRSGTALTGTLLCRIADAGGRTFVTTHFHELLHHPGVGAMTNLRVMHLTTTMTSAGLTYVRELKDGPCSPSYGIEVASACGFDAGFVREATAARLIIGAIPDPKASRYNANVIVSNCEVCGAPATESHHIRHRKDAVDGRHDGVSEHHVSNLMALCEACHVNAHAPGVALRRVQTLRGPAVLMARE